MNNKNKTLRLTLAAFFVAIEVAMAFTPIGYIPVGALSITTMHIPVILAGIMISSEFGALIGFVFGLTSFLKATFAPGITSFVFTPFITIGGVSGNFFSLVIAFGPRILLGYLSGVTYQALSKSKVPDFLGASIAAAFNTLLHTTLVLGGIWLFFGEPYATALGISKEALLPALLAVVASNGILEIIVAATIVPALARALKPAASRMHLEAIR